VFYDNEIVSLESTKISQAYPKQAPVVQQKLKEKLLKESADEDKDVRHRRQKEKTTRYKFNTLK
jgi:hypothetical protein